MKIQKDDENTKCNVQLLGIATGERDNKNNTQFTQVDEDFVPPIILCVTTLNNKPKQNHYYYKTFNSTNNNGDSQFL